MSFGLSRGPQPSSRKSSGLLHEGFLSGAVTVIVGGVVLLAVLYFIGWLSPTPESKSTGSSDGTTEDKKVAIPNAPATDAAAALTASEERQTVAFAKAKQKRAIDSGDDTLRFLGRLLDEIDRFEATRNVILENDDGKRMASDPTLVRRFRAVVEKERSERNRAERFRAVVESLLTPIRADLAEPNNVTLPKAELITELERIQSDLGTMRAAWSLDRQMLEAILSEAHGRTVPVDGPTLAIAVRSSVEADSLALVKSLEQTTATVREEMRLKLINAIEEGERKIGEARLAKLNTEKRLEVERLQNEKIQLEAQEQQRLAADKAKKEKDRLHTKVQSEETKIHLGCLFEKGFVQPDKVSGTAIYFQRGTKEQPMSLTRLRGVGALDKSKNGLSALNYVLSHTDRTKWNFASVPERWSAETQRFIQRAQDLLNELGPTLVEEGLLTP